IVPALTLTSVTSTGSCITFPCTIATLAAGATETISATFSVPSNASGSVTNNANANSSTTPDPTSLNNSASVTTPISQQGVLTVIKSGPSFAIVGNNVTFTIKVTNIGPSDAVNVMLTDPTPPRLTFVSAAAPCASGFASPCALGTMTPGQSKL